MANTIVVVGSSNTDMAVSTPRLPAAGETVLGSHLVMSPGGKGANQAVAAARLGGEVVLVARVGRDLFGEEALRQFEHERIETRFVSRDAEAPSGVALIMVGPGGQNLIAVAPGANSHLTPADIHAADEVFAEAAVVLLQLEIPLATVAAAVRAGRAVGSLVILNPAPAQSLPTTLLKQVDILTPNETEATVLTGTATPEAAALALLQQGVKTVIVTLGAAGVLLAEAGVALKRLPAFPVAAVDTTAAGDAFNGGLAVALARGEPLEAAIQFAQAVAALSVTKRGAQLSMPTAAVVQEFLQQQSRS
jgi:ribokinase